MRCIDIKEGSILEKYIRDLNGKDLKYQEQLPNPDIVQKGSKYMIAFSCKLIHEKTSSRILFEKEEKIRKAQKTGAKLEDDEADNDQAGRVMTSEYPSIFFYNLDE